MQQTVYIGADHAGFDLKEMLKEHLNAKGYIIEDMGAYVLDPTDDYPRYAKAVAEAVANHPGSVGILSCGNAEGICMAANKFDRIRAGVGYSTDAARTMRNDDNANIICIPGRIETPDDPLKIAEKFLATPFSQASRHVRRIGEVLAFEQGQKRQTAVVPTLLVQSEQEFRHRVYHAGLRQIAPVWQVDVMDGTFVEEVSFADPLAIGNMPSLPDFELHLMIEDPLPAIAAFLEHVPTVKRAIIHAEIAEPLRPLIRQIKNLNLEVGLALNPDTRLRPHLSLIEQCDLVMLMGVYPGANGQRFLGRKILRRIKYIRRHAPHVPIAIDGGMNLKTAPSVVKVGARELCVGSAIWNAQDPVAVFQELRRS